MNASEPKLDDAQIYLDRVITSLYALDRTEKTPLVAILEYLSSFIKTTRNEITLMRSAKPGERVLTTAADELGEILGETAKAAEAIMSAAEQIEAIAGRLDGQTAAPLLACVTRIYEVCAFQDITGQRIDKVVRAVQSIEQRIDFLSHICEGEVPEAMSVAASTAVAGDDQSLLNGPQLASAASSQADIDRLFASLE